MFITKLKSKHSTRALHFFKRSSKYDAGFFAGQPVSAEQDEEVSYWASYPNTARFYNYFFSNPQRIVDYMAVNCSAISFRILFGYSFLVPVLFCHHFLIGDENCF
jgi:hypothetical protein